MINKEKLLNWLDEIMEQDRKLSIGISNATSKAKHEHYAYAASVVIGKINSGCFDVQTEDKLQ